MRSRSHERGRQRHYLDIPRVSAREESVIWRTAGILLTRHGDDALDIAEERAAACEAEGDTRGFYTWRRLADALYEIANPSGSCH